MKSTSTSLLPLVSLLFVAMMGASVLTLLPLWVGALSEQNLFTGQQIGWLAAADVIGIFLSSASAIFWVRMVSWRAVVIVGLALFLLSNAACLSSHSFENLMALRALAGIGCGAAYAVALAGLGDYPRPPLAFGLMVSAQVVFGTIGFFAVPHIMDAFQIAGFFHYLNLWLLVTLVLCLLSFPICHRRPEKDRLASPIKQFNVRSGTVFATTVIYYGGVSAVWAYMERIGVGMGLASATVGNLLGIGFAISGLGSLATPWLGARLGQSATITLALAVQIAAMAALAGDNSTNAYLLYATTSFVFQFFWSFSIPLLMEQFNRVDDTGRFIVLCASAFKVGEIVGPPLAAKLITLSGVSAVLWLGMGCLLVTGVLALRTEGGPRDAKPIPVVEPS